MQLAAKLFCYDDDDDDDYTLAPYVARPKLHNRRMLWALLSQGAIAVVTLQPLEASARQDAQLPHAAAVMRMTGSPTLWAIVCCVRCMSLPIYRRQHACVPRVRCLSRQTSRIEYRLRACNNLFSTLWRLQRRISQRLCRFTIESRCFVVNELSQCLRHLSSFGGQLHSGNYWHLGRYAMLQPPVLRAPKAWCIQQQHRTGRCEECCCSCIQHRHMQLEKDDNMDVGGCVEF